MAPINAGNNTERQTQNVFGDEDNENVDDDDVPGVQTGFREGNLTYHSS